MLKLYKQIHACKRHSTGTHTHKYIIRFYFNMDENWISMYCVSVVNYKMNKFETRN